MRLTIILCVVEGVVLVGSRSAYHDPFAPYEAIMPGQPSVNLENYPCNIYRDNTSTVFCAFALKESPFVSVAVVYDHAIKWIGFTVRSDGLHLGDLILRWGEPTSFGPHDPPYEMEQAVVQWGKQLFANIAADRTDIHLSYLLPIYYVSIDGDCQSCRSR